MRPCKKCGVVKPLSEYYKHAGMTDGHLNECKECRRRYQREHRNNNIERFRAYDRERHQRPERKAYSSRHAQEFAKNNPEKRAAEHKVMRAINRGDLIRQPCEVCGSTQFIHAHHEDYAKPLDVMWLCAAHHRQRHVWLNQQRRNPDAPELKRDATHDHR